MVNEPHQCDHCNRAFGSAHEKKRHMELAHREETAMDKHVCECGKAFDTEQGLRVHKGRAHSKMARKPKTDHPWRSPTVMPKDVPDTAPEQKVNPGEEPIPDYEPPTCEICDAPAVAADLENGVYLCAKCIAEAPELIAPTDQPTSDRGFEHCDHVEDCGIIGTTDCGADPCELVAAWRDDRCEHRTDTECSNRPCHDCEIDAYKPRKLKTIHVPVVADVRVRVNEPDYRMELIETLCDLASYQLATFADADTVAEVGPTLARIKAVARDV